MGSAGDWVRISDADDGLQALLPHFEYTDDVGSESVPHAPRLSALREDEILQPDFSVDTLATLHTWLAPAATKQLLIKTVSLKVGSTAASAQVTVDFYKGVDDTGDLFFTHNYPAGDFPANTEIELPLAGLADIFPGDVIWHEITSANAFSLLGDSLAVPWHAHDDYLVTEEHIVTLESGLPFIMTDQNGDVMTSNGDVMYSLQGAI